MPLSDILIPALRRFCKDTQGSGTLEIALFFPVIFFVFGAAYTLFDSFQDKTTHTNAAYTISDALSRETDPIDNAYMDGLHHLLTFLAQTSDQAGLRVSMVRWSDDTQSYRLDWSQIRGPLLPLGDHDLDDALSQNLPKLLHNERVIVVETSIQYDPPFGVLGLDDQIIYNFAFTRPRFAPKLVWSGL